MIVSKSNKTRLHTVLVRPDSIEEPAITSTPERIQSLLLIAWLPYYIAHGIKWISRAFVFVALSEVMQRLIEMLSQLGVALMTIELFLAVHLAFTSRTYMQELDPSKILSDPNASLDDLNKHILLIDRLLQEDSDRFRLILGEDFYTEFNDHLHRFLTLSKEDCRALLKDLRCQLIKERFFQIFAVFAILISLVSFVALLIHAPPLAICILGYSSLALQSIRTLSPAIKESKGYGFNINALLPIDLT